MAFVIQLLSTAFAIVLIAYLLPSLLSADGFGSAIVAAFVLALMNVVVRPILVLLSFPFIVVTLGLSLLILNGLMLWMVSAIVPGFRVHGFWGAVLGSLLISLVSWFVASVLSPPRS